MIRCEPVNERLCWIRLKGRFYNISIICTHAPTEVSDDEAKDVFYDQLERTMDTIPMKVVIGDFNAQVGKEQHFLGTIGKHSLHDGINDNGMRLIAIDHVLCNRRHSSNALDARSKRGAEVQT